MPFPQLGEVIMKKKVAKLVNRLRSYGTNVDVFHRPDGSIAIGGQVFSSPRGAVRCLQARVEQEQAERSRRYA